MTFNLAFAQARKAGKKTFSWNGTTYTTQTQNEVKVPTRVSGGDGKTITVGVRGLTRAQAQERLKRYQKENPGKRIIMDQSMDPQSGKDRAAAKKQLEARGKSLSNTHNVQITVTAPRKNINNKTPGYVPVNNVPKSMQGRVHKNMSSGEYVVTGGPKGEMLGKTYSKEKMQKGDFDHYNSLSEKLLERNIGGDNAVAEINAGSAAVGNGATKEELESNIRKGRSDFYNVANAAFNSPNHVIMGGARLAIDPKYTFKNYKEGFLDANQSTVGVGDVFDVLNPEARFLLNFVNPTSVALSAGTYKPGEVTYLTKTAGTPTRVNVKVPNASNGRILFSRGSAPTNPRPRLDGRGYGNISHATGRASHGYGAGSHLEAVTVPAWELPVPQYHAPSMAIIPVNYGREKVVVPTREPYIINTPYVEGGGATPWLKQWYLTGNLPASNWTGGQGDSNNRETVYATTDRVWPGLEGNTGQTRDSQLLGTKGGGYGYFYVRQ